MQGWPACRGRGVALAMALPGWARRARLTLFEHHCTRYICPSIYDDTNPLRVTNWHSRLDRAYPHTHSSFRTRAEILAKKVVGRLHRAANPAAAHHAPLPANPFTLPSARPSSHTVVARTCCSLGCVTTPGSNRCNLSQPALGQSAPASCHGARTRARVVWCATGKGHGERSVASGSSGP